MSGISSKRGTIGLAVQSAKGTPATAPTVKFKLTAAPSLAPVKSRGRYTMTDTGQDAGPAYTTLLAVEGDFSVYLHPDGAAFLFAVVQGANADSGSTPNYTHTATPADDMLWVTIWREVGGVIVEQYVDCKITSLQLEGDAGQPVTVGLSVVGCESHILMGTSKTTEEAIASLSTDGYLYQEAFGKINVDAAPKKIHKISFGINRNASGYQSDGYGYDDVDPGAREVTLSFDTRFGSGAIGFAEYAEFYYGSASPADGDALSPVVGTKAFDVEFVRDANTSVKITLPQITFAAVPVSSDPGGDPIEVSVACEVEKPSGATPICTIVTKDQKATATG